MFDFDHYHGLLPSQSRELPLFSGVLQALVEASTQIQQTTARLPAEYDLDQAIGFQLDVIGEWVGISRNLATPISGVYMAWDDTAAVGWELGQWQGPFDPDSGLSQLADDQYRRLIKTKIKINYWDGGLGTLLDIWNELLPPNHPGVIVDGYDMTMRFGFEGSELSGLELVTISLGLALIKPSGVLISEVFSSTAGLPVFAWDSDTGWDTSSWSTIVNTL